MGVFQWIEDKGVLTARVEISPRIERLLIDIRKSLEWQDDYPDAPVQVPSIDALERVAEIALVEIANCPDQTLSAVEALSEQLGRLGDDGIPENYPEDAPDNEAFVIGAYALFCLDQAIGHHFNGKYSEAIDAMAEMGDALHACGFEHGAVLGLEHGHRANSSKGGKARNAKYRQLEIWAVELYKARKWKSPHQASHELKDEVLAHAKTLGVALSLYRAQQTIYGWFLEAEKPGTTAKN